MAEDARRITRTSLIDRRKAETEKVLAGSKRQLDSDNTVSAVLEAYEDVKAGNTQPAADFLEELRVKHGFPR